MMLDISPDEIMIVKEILTKHLPSDAKVWVFGSRAKGTAKKFSDLDLAIDFGKALPLEIQAELSFAFEESDLPYKVDLVDWQSISQTFRDVIDKDRVLLYADHG